MVARGEPSCFRGGKVPFRCFLQTGSLFFDCRDLRPRKKKVSGMHRCRLFSMRRSKND